MARLASDEIRSVKTVFYDDLDTVRFGNDIADEVRKTRDLAAMGSVMVSMLAGNVAPILSQAQSYDNQLLLAMVSSGDGANDSEDRLAFLRLARAGFVRVGLLKSLSGDNPPGGERYTLMNVFRASLADAEFVLSGWPELNSSRELRREVLGCLDRAPAGRMSATVPANVAARIEGLRELDRNLRQPPNGISLVDRAGGDPLEVRVNAMLSTAGPDDNAVRDAASVVTARARRDATSLNSRSNWYRLIEWELQESEPPRDSVLRVLREVVDMSYNSMVSESLGDDGMSLSAGYAYAADTAAGEFTPGQSPGKRWADLNLTPGKGNWLRWSDVPELLTNIQVLSTDARLEELERRQGAYITRYRMAHSWGVSIRIALPGAVATAVVPGFAASLITSATPIQAASVGALTGVATLVAGTPGVRAFRRRNMAKEEERLKSRDDRNAIRTGAAGWLERVRGRP